jgi:hypothetical protein
MTQDEALKLALVTLKRTGNIAGFAHEREQAAITAIREALEQPVQEPEYWNVIDPAGNVVASETDAIRGWARIAGSYKPTVEGLLGLHEQGWRVLPKVNPPAPLPMQERNFCPRCGKRRGGDVNYIHTCTPPQENT